MSEKTWIAWTDATWNPIAGCSVVSPACTNCYAMAAAARIERMRVGSWRKVLAAGSKIPDWTYTGLTTTVNGKPVWTGKIAQAPEEKLLQPLRWKRPRRIFVNSMSDLFHENVPDEVIDRVLAVMAMAPQHVFQVLTKRSARMRDYMTDPLTPARIGAQVLDIRKRGGVSDRDALRALSNRAKEEDPEFVLLPLRNVWLGVTAENQPWADKRVPELLATPAAKRFVSIEPMLGRVDLTSFDAPSKVYPGHHLEKTLRRKIHCLRKYDALRGIIGWVSGGCSAEDMMDESGLPRLDWVICGTESGAGARPMREEWARSLRNQCAATGVAFFNKQMHIDGRVVKDVDRFPTDLRVQEFPESSS